MNEIVIDLDRFTPQQQEALKARSVKEGKPMKHLLAELIAMTTQTILVAAESTDEEGQP